MFNISEWKDVNPAAFANFSCVTLNSPVLLYSPKPLVLTSVLLN